MTPLEEIIKKIKERDIDWIAKHMWWIQRQKDWLDFVKDRTMEKMMNAELFD